MTAKRAAGDERQLTLEQLYTGEAPAAGQIGRMDIAQLVRETLSDELGQVKAASDGVVDRYEIATRMSRLSGRDVTKNMLDRYSAASAEEWRFPLEALPAFVRATGSYRLLELVAEACGCRLLRGPEVEMHELVTLSLQREKLDRRIASLKRSNKTRGGRR